MSKIYMYVYDSNHKTLKLIINEGGYYNNTITNNDINSNNNLWKLSLNCNVIIISILIYLRCK